MGTTKLVGTQVIHMVDDSDDSETRFLSVNAPAWLDEEVKKELGYSDSKSGWFREAAVEKLVRDREDWTPPEDLLSPRD